MGIKFVGWDSMGVIDVDINGKRYKYWADAAYQPRWQKIASRNPKEVLDEILNLVKVGRAQRIDTHKTPAPKKQLTFRNWMTTENNDYVSQGYKRLNNIKYGPHAGKAGWWHPKTNQIIPDGLTGQGSYQQAPQMSQPAIRQPQRVQQPQQEESPWILATSKVDDEELKLQKGQQAMLRQNPNDKNNWIFASYYKGKIHNYGQVPAMEVGEKFQRSTGTTGDLQRAIKPSEGIEKYSPKEESKSFDLTPQQQEISDQFANMHSGENSHMMIGARAGTGKTTMLKHLAKTYGGRGQKWLYLVFGTKNGEEARESFPEFMKSDILTTHSYAGKVLDANNINPTERIYDYIPNLKKGNKLGMMLDGPQYREVAKSTGILHVDDLGGSQNDKYAKKWISKIWREFNREIEKIVGLLKAFNINPSSDSYDDDVKKVFDEYDINSSLEQTKEQMEKSPNKEFFNDIVSDLIGADFLSKDFMEEMAKLSTWVLTKSVPHGIDQEFDQTHVNPDRGYGPPKRLDRPIPQNLKGMRDFDDDLWFAAMHADEIDWTKPKKYDVVLADEVQDFNMAQKKLLEKLMQTGAKIVAVGDPRQSLYRFRGASASSFQDIGDMLQNNSENPNEVFKKLTQNFRSKPGLIDIANKNTVVDDIVPGIDEDPFDPAVYSNREMDSEGMMDMLGNEMEHLGELQKQTAVIARTNEPLAKTAMGLMKQGIPFEIVGWDLSNEIINLINRVVQWDNKWEDDMNVKEFSDSLNQFVDDKRDKWGNQVKKQGELKDLLEGQKALSAAIGMIGTAENKQPTQISVKELKTWLRARLGGMKENFNEQKRET